MGKIISVSNQKGGVGKTTTSVNLSASLAKNGKKTLLIDLDPQGNTTSGVGIDKKNLELSSYDILTTTKKTEVSIKKTLFKNLFIIPANINLAAAESQLMNMEKREYKLKEKIYDLKKIYDYIIIDCPPSLGALTLNALCASDSVLIPIQCEFYALEGLSQLINTIKIIKRHVNTNLEIEGILMTMYDPRLNLTRQVEKELQKVFSEKIFNTGIPRAVKLSEAPSFGKPCYYFDKWNKGTLAYLKLAKEIIKNNTIQAKRFRT